MAIKGILFDKDGTLVDFYLTWSAIARKLALEAAGGDIVEAEALLELSGYESATARFRSDSVFAAGTNADVVALWYPDLGLDERRARIIQFDAITAESGASMAVALPGIPEAIATLKSAGFKLGVATNDSTAGADKTLLALGMAQMFDAAYGYDAVANPKPAPDVVHAFCELTGLKPSEIAFVGDNRHDMATARAAGAFSVGVLSGTGTREALEALADLVLGSVAELPRWLAGQTRSDSRRLPP